MIEEKIIFSENELLLKNPDKSYLPLKNARVGIAGLGGLGSNIAVMLARAGVGYLHLVDFDKVEISNLNRQHYALRHLGMNKTDALKEQIESINPFVKIMTTLTKIERINVSSIFLNEEIVCEALDSPDAKAMLIDELLTTNSYQTIIAASGMSGLSSSNDIITKKFNDRLYVCGDGTSSLTSGLLSSRVMLCAAHQANMVLRLVFNKIEA